MRVNAGLQVWRGRKKEILVSVLLDLRDGAFSFTTELNNPSVPSCVLQIWMLAQKWLAWSHFQGKMLSFGLHATHQGHQIVRGLNFWTKENSLCCFFFPKAYSTAYSAPSPFCSIPILVRGDWTNSPYTFTVWRYSAEQNHRQIMPH